MTLFKHVRIAAIMTVLMTSVCNCQKPDDSPEGSEGTSRNNYFTYEGYAFDINSVVKFDQGDNAVELWLSSMVGATTIAEIEAEGDYIILNTHKSFLGKRDRFSDGSSKNSYIRFGEYHEFAYGDAGAAYIQASIEGDELTVEFLAQNLYTKASEIKAVIQGSYKGKFTNQVEHAYNNEWGIDRNRETLTSAVYTTYESKPDESIKNSSLTLYTGESSQAFTLTIAPSMLNKSISLPYAGSSSNLKLTYSGAIDFSLTKATGTLTTSLKDGELQINIDATNNDKRFRAVYKGAYAEDAVKWNRYKYDSKRSSLYENGDYEIVKLIVEDNGTICRFGLAPGENYTLSNSYPTTMPILTVPSDIVNAGKKLFTELTNWKFEFGDMQVWPFEDEYKHHPAESDWIEVKKEGNNYKVEFILSSIATGMEPSYIDAHYNGPASK